jgi:hypothetical protein
MVSNSTDEVDFDDLVNYKTSRKVAATAFVSFPLVPPDCV